MREAEAPAPPSSSQGETAAPNETPVLPSDFLLSWLEIGKQKTEKNADASEQAIQTIEVEDQPSAPKEQLAYIDIEENPFKVSPQEKEQEVEKAVEQDLPVESLFERRQEVKDQRSYVAPVDDTPKPASEPTPVGDILAAKSYLLPREQPATVMPVRRGFGFDMSMLMVPGLYRRVVGFTFAITAVVIFLILLWSAG